MEPRKQAICEALSRFIRRRPGLEFGNYGDVAAYRSEMRGITKDRHHAETLLRAVMAHDSITANDLIRAATGAYSGRLTIVPPFENYAHGPCTGSSSPYWRIEYVTGQYFPTEYRRAVCAVLASALWDWTRENAMPAVGAYCVESWSQLGKGRTRHAVQDTREKAEKQLEELGGSSYGHICTLHSQRGPCERITWVSAGDWLRAHFRREFGRGIASRWFS